MCVPLNCIHQNYSRPVRFLNENSNPHRITSFGHRGSRPSDSYSPHQPPVSPSSISSTIVNFHCPLLFVFISNFLRFFSTRIRPHFNRFNLWPSPSHNNN